MDFIIVLSVVLHFVSIVFSCVKGVVVVASISAPSVMNGIFTWFVIIAIR